MRTSIKVGLVVSTFMYYACCFIAGFLLGMADYKNAAIMSGFAVIHLLCSIASVRLLKEPEEALNG